MGNKKTMKRKYVINEIKYKLLSTDGDKHRQYLKGVVWIEENHFMATDAENAKLKMYFFWKNIENI